MPFVPNIGFAGLSGLFRIDLVLVVGGTALHVALYRKLLCSQLWGILSFSPVPNRTPSDTK